MVVQRGSIGSIGQREPERDRTQHGPPGTHAALRAVGLTKTYGTGESAIKALDDVTVAFSANQFTTIMGPSGSGKSTLMHCLAGLDTVTAGHVFLSEMELTALDDTALSVLRRDRIGFVFQAFNLLPTFTARQNIMLPLELAGKTADRTRFTALVSTLGIEDRLDHRPSELSGGQQQRVAIARALVAHPDVVFADEPTGNLDSRASNGILEVLRRSVCELGQTVVMVTHDPMAAAHSDRVVLMEDRRSVGELNDPTVDTVVKALRGMEDN